MTASLFPELQTELRSAISLWQPWATLWAAGVKRNETRHWPLPGRYHGQSILIHAARRWNEETADLCREEPFASELVKLADTLRNTFGGERREVKIGAVWVAIPIGCLIGRVTVTGSLSTHSMQPPFLENCFGDYSSGRYAWLGADHAMLNRFIPFRGHQQFFTYDGEL